uniref:Uncharacterized protein n=1 Tax=Rhizophora mucronata TaxID=61149 RepID=A0A2P2JUT4_RHIMU
MVNDFEEVNLMATKLAQLQSKACQASQFVAKHGRAYYKQLLEQNKQYVQEPPTAEKCNLLANQLFFTRLARLVGWFLYLWLILMPLLILGNSDRGVIFNVYLLPLV